MRQLHVQDGRLQRVDAKVAADVAVVVLRTHSVHAIIEQLLGERVIVGGDRAGVAERAEILRREEREAADWGQ